MTKLIIKASIDELSKAMDFIKEEMEKKAYKKSEISRSMLICEEILVTAINQAKDDSEIFLTVKKKIGKLVLDIESTGSKLEIDKAISTMGAGTIDAENEDAEYVIRNILMRHFSDRIKYSQKGARNYIKVILDRDENFQTKLTLSSMLVALVLGLLFRFVLPGLGFALNSNIFSPISTIFIKCMKCIVGPIVFLSILNSVIGFDDMKVLGRIGAKVMALYTFTSVIATFIGLIVFFAFDPGELGSYVLEAVDTIEAGSSSGIIDMIVGFFPGNFVAAFLNNDTIQLIVLAIACGIALNSMGERNATVKNIIGSLNEMVNIICGALSKTIPLVVLCTITSTILTAEVGTMISLIYMAGICIVGFAIMVVAYCLLLFVFVRVNPLILLKKYFNTALTVFTLASSNATIPLNLEFSNKIGVSKKVASFAIPLGATINMDGGCVFYPIVVLFLSKIYGVTFDMNMLIQLFFLVMMISMGTPGVAGGTSAFIIPMLSLAGVPAEMGLLIVGIDCIIDMFRTSVNTLGDQTATLIAANSEGLFAREKYYS